MNLENNYIVNKPIIAVTMATSRQGIGVVRELSKNENFRIRAITRDPNSSRALELGMMKNVELIKGDLLDERSLEVAFDGVHGIFGNTTPTKGWKIARGSIVRDYEIEQGFNLVNQVKMAYKKGNLKHFIFSSICKAKNPLRNDPAPGHFTSKWDIEEYIKQNGLYSISTILRPVSYFENFENKIPGYNISATIFPGIVSANHKWQTIAVDDIGKWTCACFASEEKYKERSINIAGEELTGNEMALILQQIYKSKNVNTKYLLIPRPFIKLIEYDIGLMADWIERTGYGADMKHLEKLKKELGIKSITLRDWLESKISTNKENKQNEIWAIHWKNSELNYQQ